MKFGRDYNQQDDSGDTGTSDYLRYFKNPETTFQLLQEPDEWTDYWEHFNPGGGYPFPCTRERSTCPGCTSENEKMKKASKKIAVQVLEGEYVNAYKLPKTVADKLANRRDRVGTLLDRQYTIYKIQSKNTDGSTKTDYDVEGGDKSSVNVEQLRPKFRDVEAILTSMYEEAWGNPDSKLATESGAKAEQKQSSLADKIKAQKEPEWAKRPKDEPAKVWSEEELRALPFPDLLIVCSKESVDVPEELVTKEDNNAVVDWLLDQ